MYKQQQHCNICLENQVTHNIPCRCSLCLHCLVNWFEEKNQDTAIHQLKCPLDCNYTYTREQLIKMCHAENQSEKIQNILLKEYLKSQDIRPCPKAKCEYYGFVDDNKCEDDLICAKCKYTWKDPSLFPLHMLLEYQITSSISDLGNFIFCFLHTFPCPECGILIQRNGGCPHMTCKKCNYQFCWTCKGPWIKHNRAACSSVILMFMALILYVISNIFWSLSFFQYFLYLLKPLGYLVYVFFANFVIISLIAMTVHAIYFLFFESRRKPLSSFLFGILEIFGAILIYFTAVWVNEYLDFTFFAYIYIVIAEFIIFLIILAIIFRQVSKYIIGIILVIAIGYYFLLEGLCLFFYITPLLYSRRNPSAIVTHLLPHLAYYNYCDPDSLVCQNLPYIFIADVTISVLGCVYARRKRFRR